MEARFTVYHSAAAYTSNPTPSEVLVARTSMDTATRIGKKA